MTRDALFVEYWEQCQRGLLRTISYKWKDHQGVSAEDIAQEVATKAYQDFDPDDCCNCRQFAQWVRLITKTTLYLNFRHLQRNYVKQEIPVSCLTNNEETTFEPFVVSSTEQIVLQSIHDSSEQRKLLMRALLRLRRMEHQNKAARTSARIVHAILLSHLHYENPSTRLIAERYNVSPIAVSRAWEMFLEVISDLRVEYVNLIGANHDN